MNRFLASVFVLLILGVASCVSNQTQEKVSFVEGERLVLLDSGVVRQDLINFIRKKPGNKENLRFDENSANPRLVIIRDSETQLQALDKDTTGVGEFGTYSPNYNALGTQINVQLQYCVHCLTGERSRNGYICCRDRAASQDTASKEHTYFIYRMTGDERATLLSTINLINKQLSSRPANTVIVSDVFPSAAQPLLRAYGMQLIQERNTVLITLSQP